MYCNNIIFDPNIFLEDLRGVYLQHQHIFTNDMSDMSMPRFLSLLIPYAVSPAVVALQSNLPLKQADHSIGVYSVYVRDSVVQLFSEVSARSAEALKAQTIKDIAPGYSQWIEHLLQKNPVEDVLSFLARADTFLSFSRTYTASSAAVQLNAHLVSAHTHEPLQPYVDLLVRESNKQPSLFLDCGFVKATSLLGDRISVSNLGFMLEQLQNTGSSFDVSNLMD